MSIFATIIDRVNLVVNYVAGATLPFGGKLQMKRTDAGAKFVCGFEAGRFGSLASDAIASWMISKYRSACCRPKSRMLSEKAWTMSLFAGSE